MATISGFAAWTGRAKDIIVQQLRAHFSLLLASASTNALKEQPLIEKFGLAGQTSAESFVQVIQAMPHANQRIPTVAVMSAPGTEKKMGIGRQVIHTYHDPVTGKPMIREIVGGDMTVVIEISTTDTNIRSELTDIVHTFFTTYAEETEYAFLGDTNIDPFSGVPNNYQLILKSEAVIQGETQQARPDGEAFEMIYFNRITVPILFLDYADREAFDVSVCFNPTFHLEDDANFLARFDIVPLDEPRQWQFANSDNFEINSGIGFVNGINTQKWDIVVNPSAIVRQIDTTLMTSISGISGNGLVAFKSLSDGSEAGVLVNKNSPGIVSGRLRTKFRFSNGNSALVICAMQQGRNPLESDCYQLLVRPGSPARLAIIKGNVSTGPVTVLGEGSRVNIPIGVNLSAQFEWKVDPQRSRIRLRGYISHCESSDYGALQKRLEIFDNTNAFLTSVGESVGFRENPDTAGDPGAVFIDDPDVIQEIGNLLTNPAKVG